MRTIPILNIYYLLCYAWNKLEEKDLVQVSGSDSHTLLDLFARVIIGGLNHLFKRGLDRGYVDFSEDTRTLRAKICWAPTIKRNLLSQAQAHCQFDELSYNVLHNQILKAAIRLLVYTDTLDSELRNILVGFYRRLQDVDDIILSGPIFSRVQLHQNNYFYEFLLNICRFIYENLLVSEDPGETVFRDFLQDEKKMAHLFEEFVRNFYRLEFPKYKVKREDIRWDLIPTDEISKELLPKMTTDISVETEDSKVVIDTKYYKDALIKRYGKEKLRPENLYQIAAYLKNLKKRGGINERCAGMLLYPVVNKTEKAQYKFIDQMVLVRMINLNQDWQGIDQDLRLILTEALMSADDQWAVPS